MEPVTPSRRGLRCPVKCGLCLLVSLIVCGGVWGYHRGTIGWQVFEAATGLHELSGVFARYAQAHRGHFPDRLSELFLQEDVPPVFFVVGWGSGTPVTGGTRQARAGQMDSGGHCSYRYLGAGRSEANLTGNMVLMYEADGINPLQQVFCLMGDGHAEFMTVPDAIAAILRTVKAGPPTTSPAPGK